MQVRDVMTEATITETPADKLRSAAERMWREQTGAGQTVSGQSLGRAAPRLGGASAGRVPVPWRARVVSRSLALRCLHKGLSRLTRPC